MNEQSTPKELKLNTTSSVLSTEDRITMAMKMVNNQNEIIKVLAEKISIISKKLERLDTYALENRHYIENHEHINNNHQ